MVADGGGAGGEGGNDHRKGVTEGGGGELRGAETGGATGGGGRGGGRIAWRMRSGDGLRCVPQEEGGGMKAKRIGAGSLEGQHNGVATSRIARARGWGRWERRWRWQW